MPTKGTAIRGVRVSDALWAAAQAKAEREATTVSDFLRACLERWVE